jgi:hypothetical protein
MTGGDDKRTAVICEVRRGRVKNQEQEKEGWHTRLRHLATRLGCGLGATEKCRMGSSMAPAELGGAACSARAVGAR